MAKKVCLDPGHYGSRYNAGATSGYYESAMTWQLTMYEKAELESMGIEVALTRNSIDEDPSLSARGKKAKGCDAFVSNHSNACGTESVSRVVAIYYVSRSGTEVDERSRQLADMIAPRIEQLMGVNGAQTYSKLAGSDRDKNGKKDDNYYGVLNGAWSVGVPGIIVEHSFHTNKYASAWLMDDSNLRKLARLDAECIAEFLGVPVSGSKPVEAQRPAEQVNTTTEEKKDELYRIRKTWEDSNSQVIAFSVLENAKKYVDEHPGYSAFDSAGNKVYPTGKVEKPKKDCGEYKVRVRIENLYMRTGASISHDKIGYIPEGVYTIVEEENGKINSSGKIGKWGRLKSKQMYKGKTVDAWICLNYAEVIA